MSNELSAELQAEIFAQESGDPFLTLVTLTHVDFTIYLVNNSKDITSRGNVYTALPMKIRLPMDDGETARDFQVDFDNASRILITNLRSVTGNIGVKFEMILASMPNVVQMSYEDLVLSSITYTGTKVSAKIVFDSFLGVEMTSERYQPTNYPGLF